MGCNATTGIPKGDNFEILRVKYDEQEKMVNNVLSQTSLNVNNDPKKLQEQTANFIKLKNELIPELEKRFKEFEGEYEKQKTDNKLGPTKLLKEKYYNKASEGFKSIQERAKEQDGKGADLFQKL